MTTFLIGFAIGFSLGGAAFFLIVQFMTKATAKHPTDSEGLEYPPIDKAWKPEKSVDSVWLEHGR